MGLWGGCTWLKQWSIIKFILSLFLLTHNYSFLLEFHYLQFRCLGFISGCWSSNWLAVCSLLVAFQPHGHFRVCHLCCGLPVGLRCRRLHRHRPDRSWRHCFPSRTPPPPGSSFRLPGSLVQSSSVRLTPPRKVPTCGGTWGLRAPTLGPPPSGGTRSNRRPAKKNCDLWFCPPSLFFFFLSANFFLCAVVHHH